MIGTRHLHTVSANVLGYSAGFTRCDFGRADRIQQRSFAVIYVAHDGYHRSTWQLNIVGISCDQFLEFLFSYHLLERNESDFVTEALAQLDRDIVVERLIDGRKDLALQEQGNYILRLDPKFFRKLLDGRAFNYTHGLKLAWSCRRFHPTGNTIFKRQGFGGRNEVA